MDHKREIQELRRQLDASRKENSELKGKLKQEQLQTSVFKSIPGQWGYIKDKDGRFVDVFGEEGKDLYYIPNEFCIGKNNFELIQEYKEGPLKMAPTSTVVNKINLNDVDFLGKLERTKENILNFYYKTKNEPETWILINSIASPCREDCYVGFMSASGTKENISAVRFDDIKIWTSQNDTNEWQGCYIGLNDNEASFLFEHDELLIQAKGDLLNSYYFVHKRITGPFQIIFHIQHMEADLSGFDQTAGVMIIDDLSLINNQVKLLYHIKTRSLFVRQFYRKNMIKTFTTNHKQEMQVINTAKFYQEQLGWVKSTKVPIYDTEGTVNGIMVVHVDTAFRQILDDMLGVPLIVFAPDGMVKIHTRAAYEVLFSKYGLVNLNLHNVFDIYKPVRDSVDDFESIISGLLSTEGMYMSPVPVKIINKDDHAHYLYEYYQSFANAQTGLVDRIALVLFERKPEIKDLLPHIKTNMDFRIKKINDYLEKHYQDPDLSIENMSEKIGISYSTSIHVYKKETGITINHYLTRIRVDQAAMLLVQTQKSILDIAIECGFNSSQYFTQVFKKAYKISPLKYRVRYS